MNDKNFVKVNIKIVMNISQCTLAKNFSEFEELQFLEQICPQKIWVTKPLNE